MKVYVVMFTSPDKGEEVQGVFKSESMAREETRDLMDEYLVQYGADDVSHYWYQEMNLHDGEAYND